MAFRMNRPTIKGTANHKASIAKAKAQSIVSQRRTQADAGLVGAADALGKSYKPQAIDFELDKINIDVPEKKKGDKGKKEKSKVDGIDPTNKTGMVDVVINGVKTSVPAEDRFKYESGGSVSIEDQKKEKPKKNGKIVEGVETTVKGIVGVPVAVGYGLYKVGKYIVNGVGDVVKDAKKHIKNKKEQNDKEWEIKQQAKKDAEFVGEGEIDDPETNYKNTKQYKDIKKKEKEEAALAEQQANSEARFNELMVEDEEENDFSAIEAEPDVDYESSGAVDRGYKTWKHKQDAENIRSARETSGRMNTITEQRRQEAAKKHNVKVEDLEAKEIGGKKEFFPKQSAVGGKEETRWDDELGRFRKPEATIPVGKEEQEKAVEEMKPKYFFPKQSAVGGGYAEEGQGQTGGTQWDDELGRFRIPSGGISDEKYDSLSDDDKKVYDTEMTKRDTDMKTEMEALRPKQDNIKPEDLGDLPSMVNSGDVALDPVTNQYEYTDQYIKRNQPKVVKPVVEEKKTTTSNARQRRLDKKYENAGPSVRANMEADGYVPPESKTAMNMRDNRIYRNAVKGGIVQQNMIKSGYIPE